MTKNEFILRTIISMAGNSKNLHIEGICTPSDIKCIIKTAKALADAAEAQVTFE